MFVYEGKDSLNIALTSNVPVATPDIVVKGYKNGAAVIVGDNIYGVKSGEEFERAPKTLVYQKDNKLAITFNGVLGMSAPDVTVDELEPGLFALEASGEAVTLSIAEGKVHPVTEEDDELIDEPEEIKEPEETVVNVTADPVEETEIPDVEE